MTIYEVVRASFWVGVLSLSIGGVHGQILHSNDPLPAFEVTTLKPWQPPPPPPAIPGKPPVRFDPGGPPKVSNRVRRITPVSTLIQSTYNLPMGSDRLVGGPDWINSDQYELQATIEGTEFAAMEKMPPEKQQERLHLMEQSLLADRFKLKVHFETREVQAYVLEVAKGGPKLTPSKEGEPVSMFTSVRANEGGEIRASNITMDHLVHSPLLLGGRTAVDQTGLTGAYSFVIKMGPDDSIYTALQEQLGLRLVPKKVPMEVMVIDHVERPSLN